MLLARYTGVTNLLSLETLRQHHSQITAYADSSYAAAVAFLCVYILIIAFTIPGGTFLNLAAGLFFRQPLSTLLTLVGGVIGSTGAYLFAQSAFGQVLQQRAKGMYLYSKIKAMVEGNSCEATVITLAAFRLVPFMPGWINNSVPALLEVPLAQFVMSVAIASVPGSYFYAVAGDILGDMFIAGSVDEELSSIGAFLLRACLSPRMIFPTVLLLVWFGMLIFLKIKLQPAPAVVGSKRPPALANRILNVAAHLSLVAPLASHHSHHE